MKKFDIVVFDGVKRREEHGVMANSPKDLADIYAMTDEKIVQVLREYEDDDCKKYGQFDPAEILSKMNTPMGTGQLRPGGGMMKISGEMQKIIDSSISASHPKPAEVPRGTIPPTPGTFDGLIPASTPKALVAPGQPPGETVFFKVGDVECKIENGTVYQKKWSRATESDMKKLRVVFDKSGKDVPMAGKHVEILKWEVANEDPEPDLIENDENPPENDKN